MSLRKLDHSQPFLSEALGITDMVDTEKRAMDCFNQSLIPTEDPEVSKYLTSRFAEKLLNGLSRKELAYYAARYLQSQMPDISLRINKMKTELFRKFPDLDAIHETSV
jgi:hypothetical protein